jgi:hypothetical protein
MKRIQAILPFFLTLLIFPCVAHAQASSGIISPSRATDWSQAGIPGGLPDANWPVCQTINAYSGDGSAIQTALSNCNAAHPAGGVVVLGAGTFNLSSGALFPGGHLVIRGQGANSTRINYTGLASGCNGQGGIFCANGDGTYRGNPSNTVHNWTAGYTQGATQITLDSVSSVVAGQSILILNQCDTGFTGANCTSGAPTDNGGYFVCATPWVSAGIGCNIAGESADGSAWRAGPSWQQEYVLAVAINQGGCGATCVTVSPALHHPNWASGQSPQAIVVQPVTQVGVENMTIDGSADFGSSGSPQGQAVGFNNAYQCWLSGVRTINGGARASGGGGLFFCQFENNYFYGNPANYGDNSGVMINGGGGNLIVNNICEQVHLCILNDGPDDFLVAAYNFSINQQASGDGMGIAIDTHSGPGNDFTLLEGNAVDKVIDDIDHGGHLNMTKFRNFIWGWESCANGQCGSTTAKATQVVPVVAGYATRYSAFIANVLGTPGYHNLLQDVQAFGSGTIYELGAGYGSQPADPLGTSTVLRWGNWDSVTNNVRWCGNSSNSGWLTTCLGLSEVPTNAPTYPNSVPTRGDTGAGQTPLPASFIYSSKPSWFGSTPWPPIGPDVSGGNVGQCAGTLNVPGKFNGLAALNAGQCAGSGINMSAWAGHVNAIPAMSCYFNVMGGNPDGTGAPLPFDAGACYGSSSSSGNPPPGPPAPPTQLIAVVN